MAALSKFGPTTIGLLTLGFLGESAKYTLDGHMSYPEGLEGNPSQRFTNVLKASLRNPFTDVARDAHLTAASRLPVREYSIDEALAVLGHLHQTETTYNVPVDASITVDKVDKETKLFSEVTMHISCRHYPAQLVPAGSFAYSQLHEGAFDPTTRTVAFPYKTPETAYPLLATIFKDHVDPENTTVKVDVNCKCCSKPVKNYDPEHKHFSEDELKDTTRATYYHPHE